jgi:HlyD family secretion protein
MRKWVVAGLIGVGVVAAILILPSVLTGTQGAATAQELDTAVVERTTLNDSIESSGTVAAARSITLTFATSGVVNTVNVEVGDIVTAGQVLATVETSDLEYQIQLQERALIVQQANYDQLIAPPSESEIAQAEASLASAQSQLLQAQVSLRSAPNSVTLNCSDVTDRQRDVDDAQADYDDYVAAGFELDATFLPDPDSTFGLSLRDALEALEVAQAQCDNTTTVEEYELQVASAQASVDQAQASLDALLAGADAEDVAASLAQLEQQELELEDARSALEDAELAAPFDGVVSAVDVVVGNSVSSSTAVISLVDDSQLHVDVQIDELDIPQVELGQSVIVAPDALEDATLTGVVARVAPVGETTDGVVTYEVRIDLTDARTYPIFVGMTTDVEIVIGSEPDVLVVPTEAIQRAGINEFVEVVNDDGTTRSVNVTTGTTLDGYTVISGDIEEGLQVVIPEEEAQTGGFGGPFGGP